MTLSLLSSITTAAPPFPKSQRPTRHLQSLFGRELLKSKPFLHFDVQFKRNLLEELRQRKEDGILPVPLNGLTNVWCLAPLVLGKLLLVNFVETNYR